LSSTTSPTPRVRVPRHVARLVAWLVPPLVVDYSASAACPGASARRAARRVGSLSTTSPTPCVRVPRHVARLVAWLITPLVVDYFASAARPGASARGAVHRAGSSSTTSPTPRVRLRRHVARLIVWLVTPQVVDYFASAVCPGASAHRVAHYATRRRLLHLRHASGCLGTSRGSSRRLVVDYFTHAACLVASAHHTARRVARHTAGR
jgi:hypothetical protein